MVPDSLADLRRLNVLCYRYFMRKTTFKEKRELADNLSRSRIYSIWFNRLGGKWQRTQVVNRRYKLMNDGFED